MRSSGIMQRARILAPFLFLATLILVSVVLDKPLPRADIVYANTAVKCFLAGWLIWRFGFAKRTKLSDFDRHASFVAGSYVLLSTFAEYFQDIKGFLATNKI